jgi:hypothetical protein
MVLTSIFLTCDPASGIAASIGGGGGGSSTQLISVRGTEGLSRCGQKQQLIS